MVSAERAVYSVWILLTVASGLLVYSLMTGDYRLAYVAAHSNKAMSGLYKFTAWWGGQEGSLLLWSWLLATYSAIVVYTNRRKFRDMMPIVIAIMMTTQSFFLGMITFVASPFQVLMAGSGIIDVGDGNGLSPLLQWWTMAIHPPLLYLGYVGFTVPFAFAMASLDHASSRAKAGFTPPAAGPSSLGCFKLPALCSAWVGRIRCWAGEAIGAGTRWRTPR